MDDTNRLILTDDSGQEHEMEIVLTFDNEDETRHFVLFTDPEDEEGNVYAYSYDEDGNMDEVTDPQELEMCEEVLGAFQKEDDGEKAQA
ncbi:MAG: RHS repeat domain-containing protein [Bulleidia sp.]|nr:RHS repeat domain-containing protein [Bulleidia sp.]